MPSTLVIATIVAGVLVMSSCKWFSSAPKGSEFNIIGKWKLDSIAPGKDTSNAIGLLAISTLKPVSLTGRVEFRQDSTYKDLYNSTTGKYFIKQKELYIAEDTSFVPYSLNIVNDSIIKLSTKDSSLIVLRKQ